MGNNWRYQKLCKDSNKQLNKNMSLLVTPITIFLVPANKKFLTHTLFRNMLVYTHVPEKKNKEENTK